MDLILNREYFPEGTNGELLLNGLHVCFTIELPWLANARQISCIPEGKYPLVTRYNDRFGWHLLLQDVPGRSGILIHPANKAKTELRGCIAPVFQLRGAGAGVSSRAALEALTDLVLKRSLAEKVYIHIKKRAI